MLPHTPLWERLAKLRLHVSIASFNQMISVEMDHIELALHALASLLFVLHCCLNSLYKPSKKGLSSITKMGEIERACVAPSVVLVINDNLYGLMFSLRYSCRTCP